MDTVIILTSYLVLGLVVAFLFLNVVHQSTFLPPGPKGTFFSGVQHQLPKNEPWKKYAEWSKEFQSPVISFRVYNETVIVLNELKSVRDLLERRSHIYSDRPLSWMLSVICGRAKAIFNISSSDPRHRKYRQLFQTEVGERAMKRYWEMMREELRTMLDGLEKTPDEWQQHIIRNYASVIMRLTFGYKIHSLDDPFIQSTEETGKISGWATAPGRWLVNYYTILRFVPSFLPGTGWKRQGHAWRERLRTLSQIPHNWVKEQMAKGSYEPSFTSRLLQGDGDCVSNISTEEEDIIQWCAGGLYAGATHTTISALTSFVLLMALHPQVQQKAQREIDLVFNQNQQSGFIDTPDLARLPMLKYLTVVMKEVLRFAPVGNLALPHRLVVDDEYMGFRLPRGATVIPNIWAIMHDPELYPDPFVFSPERFAMDDQPDPRQFAYGFGRRSCPGSHFAETTILLAMAGILARFHIDSKEKGFEGRAVVTPQNVEFTTGLTSHIKPFPIHITPRKFDS
ncbi:cytochrome P450 [Pholiota conissans]|uniref:Cytochrome P450 n=1 Tax=Pholiota conissans TaxID=109636 RepID=A0A9P6D0B2_9AGAR|nr:cytochrome P450 [Pholiota conissans]